MIKTKIVHEENSVTVVTCDFCRKESQSRHAEIKQCYICKKNVCWECSEHVDCQKKKGLANYTPNFIYVCKSCWVKGEEIRQAIVDGDEEESDLSEMWKSLRCGKI